MSTCFDGGLIQPPGFLIQPPSKTITGTWQGLRLLADAAIGCVRGAVAQANVIVAVASAHGRIVTAPLLAGSVVAQLERLWLLELPVPCLRQSLGAVPLGFYDAVVPRPSCIWF